MAVAHQASLSFTISWSLPKFASMATVMPSSHFILWCLLLLSSIFPRIRTFTLSQLFASGDQNTGVSTLASVLPKYLGLIFFNIDWFDLLAAKGLSRVFSTTTIKRYQFFGTLPSLRSSSCDHMWPLESLDHTDLCQQSDVLDFQHTV